MPWGAWQRTWIRRRAKLWIHRRVRLSKSENERISASWLMIQSFFFEKRTGKNFYLKIRGISIPFAIENINYSLGWKSDDPPAAWVQPSPAWWAWICTALKTRKSSKWLVQQSSFMEKKIDRSSYQKRRGFPLPFTTEKQKTNMESPVTGQLEFSTASPRQQL